MSLDSASLRLRRLTQVDLGPAVSVVGDAAASVGRWVGVLTRPLTGVMTPYGWAALAALPLVAWAGWGLGWVEFRTAAVVLGLVLAASLAFLVGQAAFTADVRLGSARIRVGEEVHGSVTVRNPRQTPSRGAWIDLPVGRAVASFTLPRLGAGEEHEVAFTVPGRRRGVIVIGPVGSRRGDPVGLFARQQAWSRPVELFVHPRTVRLEASAIGFLKDVEGVTTQNLSSSDVSFHALRDYVPGDDRRAIHWRTTARTGRLMVRQFEETMRSHLLLVLSLRTADFADEAAFELAVSTVASLGRAALDEGRTVSIVTAAGALAFTHGVGVLDALCRVEPDAKAPTLREVASGAIARVPSASVVGLVTGSKATAADLRAAHLTLPPEVSTFAIRCGADLVAARRRSAGLTVLDVAQLDELPRGIRKVR